MRPITLSDVTAIPDILDQTRFSLYLGTIPGGGDTQGLRVKCVNAVLPPFGNESYDAPMGGFSPNYRGRKNPTTPISFTFYEDMKMKTLKALRAWHEIVVGSESGDSEGYVAQYSVDGGLSVFDTTGKEIATHEIIRMYPVDITETTMSVESSAPIQVQVQFKYLTFKSNTHSNR